MIYRILLFFVFAFLLIVNSFIFLFFNMGFVVCGLLRRFTPRNDEGTKGSIHKLVIARVRRTRGNLAILGLSLREPKVRGNLGMATITPNPHCHCEGLKSPWQSRYET